MPIAVVALDFDPLLQLGDRAVRLDTVVLALVLLASLLVAARIASRTSLADGAGRFAHGSRLRVDDLVFIVLAVVPGAVIGGRFGYVLAHLDYYGANPGAVLDPAQGSLQLGLGVVGGALTGGYAAWLLEQPVGRWLHVAALPLLLAIAGGKLAQALGGVGQGMPSSVPWATSYLGPGPWGSLAPEIPSHPSQLYEAVGTTLVALLLLALLSAGAFGRRDGRAFLAAVGGWAAIRLVVAGTWRDVPVLGPMRSDQLVSVLVVAGCVVGSVLLARGSARLAGLAPAEPHWPDPETRPRF